MKKLSLLVLALSLLGVADAAAQSQGDEGKGFLSINGGYQSRPRQTFSDSRTFPLYGEQGRVDAIYRPKPSTILGDVSAGIRLGRRLGVGFGMSLLSSGEPVDITAMVPNPVFRSQGRDVAGTATGFEQSEAAVHLQVLWMVPVSDRVQVTLGAGPTIFIVTQDILTGVGVAEGAPPFDQAAISSVETLKERATAVGANGGVDIAYGLTRRLGAGVFLRYARASADISLTSVDVGGFQTGAGLRIRF